MYCNQHDKIMSVIHSGKCFSILIPTILEILMTRFFLSCFCCGWSVSIWMPKCMDQLQYGPFNGTEPLPEHMPAWGADWKKRTAFMKWVIKFSSLHSTDFPHFLDQSCGLDWVQRERFFRSWIVYMISGICVNPWVVCCSLLFFALLLE